MPPLRRPLRMWQMSALGAAATVDPQIAMLIALHWMNCQPERLVIPNFRMDRDQFPIARAKLYFRCSFRCSTVCFPWACYRALCWCWSFSCCVMLLFKSRFSVEEIDDLIEAFRLPAILITRERYSVPVFEAMCMLLRRFTYPCRLEPELVEFFGHSKSLISATVTHLVMLLIDKFGYLIEFNEDRIVSQRSIWTAAIARKTGNLLDCIWGFIDGTARSCCRPIRSQKVLYSGHKRVHCIKFQSVLTPDGLIASMFGPVEGRRHDLFLLAKSGLQERIMGNPALNGGLLYGDPGYTYSDTIMCPFKGSNLTAAEHEFNKVMSTVRIAVEHGFGRVINLWSYLDFQRSLRVLSAPIGAYYLVAVLLTNCLTCVQRQNQMSKMFGLAPPSLKEYLSSH